MKLSNLRQLADATGVTVEWLATGRGPMRPGDPPPAPAPEPAKPQETETPTLKQVVDMDRLARAIAVAQAALAQAGKAQDPPVLAQMAVLIYDNLPGLMDP